jgi:two-component system chemotaxis sensor kinase CheA
MVHVLRNIADHGLETTWERERAGKPQRANVWMSARVEADRLRLSFRDDGRGVDWERVSARARERGLAASTREELCAALLRHGFSTLDSPSALSGRGAGLSAVASEVAALAGTLTLTSEPEQGTTLIIDLPSALLA